MTTGRVLPLADRLIPGGVQKTLTAWATDGLSTDTMAERLRAEHRIEVTRETVRRWCHYYGITTAGMNTDGDAA